LQQPIDKLKLELENLILNLRRIIEETLNKNQCSLAKDRCIPCLTYNKDQQTRVY
jgi:hypothetical protein